MNKDRINARKRRQFINSVDEMKEDISNATDQVITAAFYVVLVVLFLVVVARLFVSLTGWQPAIGI